MITYAEKRIAKEDITLFRKVETIIGAVDNFDLPAGVEPSCHMIADAVGDLLGIKVVRGYFLPGFEHSWLETENGNKIDVYPWGTIGGPVLIAGDITSLYYFKPNGHRYIGQDYAINVDPRECVDNYDEYVKIIKDAFREVLSKTE